LAEKLRSSIETGLVPVDFAEREEQFGSNFKPPMARTPFYKLFFGALDDFMLKLLLVCAVISISFDMGFASKGDLTTGTIKNLNNRLLISLFTIAWIEGASIFIAVFIVATVGSYNDYKKEEQFLKLQAIGEKDNVVRILQKSMAHISCR
jgi:Ca2+ transporting ATPase